MSTTTESIRVDHRQRVTDLPFTPSSADRERALGVLAGMREIAEAEMMVRGLYLHPQATANGPAICGGHQACAVGSLWLAAGAQRVVAGSWTLPGILLGERNEHLAGDHGLALAFAAANEAAAEFLDAHQPEREEAYVLTGVAGSTDFEDALEALFEGCWGADLLEASDKDGGFGCWAMLAVIDSATAKVRKVTPHDD